MEQQLLQMRSQLNEQTAALEARSYGLEFFQVHVEQAALVTSYSMIACKSSLSIPLLPLQYF